MKFVAFERSTQGTGASRRLRNAGKVPGIVYGGEAQPQMTSKVLLRDLQMHPVRQQILHVDFQRVSAKTRLHTKVPLHYKGEEESPAVKLGKALISPVLTEIEISCLPADLPEAIEVDLSKLEIGATLHLSDVALPKGVKPVLHGKNDPVLVTVVMPAASSESEDEAPAPAPAGAGERGRSAPRQAQATANRHKPPFEWQPLQTPLLFLFGFARGHKSLPKTLGRLFLCLGQLKNCSLSASGLQGPPAGFCPMRPEHGQAFKGQMHRCWLKCPAASWPRPWSRTT